VVWEAIKPDLREAVAADAADPNRGHGAPRPFPARAGGVAPITAMSAATTSRPLRDIRQHGATRRRSAPSAAVKRSAPVHTSDGWDDPPTGSVEADLVAHSGPVTNGSFVQTLVLTDIATGWSEHGPPLVRYQHTLNKHLMI
jgi:hypothetical protein